MRSSALAACAVAILALGGACSDGDDATADDLEDRVRIISTTTSSTAPPASSTTVSGQTTSTSTSTSTGSSTPVEATSTTSAVESTTTTEDVPDVSNLTVDDRISTVGLGPVFVGMTLAEAAQAAGTGFEPEGSVVGPCTFHVATDFADAGVRWLVAFDRIAAIHVDQPGVVTLSGLGVGSSAADLRARFGDQLQERPSPFAAGITELVLVPVDENDAGQRVIFEVDGAGSVVAYRSGQLPEVEYSSSCGER